MKFLVKIYFGALESGVIMKQYDVISIGLATVDLIAGTIESETLKRDTTYLDTLELRIGGDAVNQAVVLSRLGSKAGVMALVGNDYWGQFLMNQLKVENVDSSMIIKNDGIPTTVSIVMLDGQKERHFAVQKGTMDYFGIQHINFDIVKKSDIISLASNLALKSMDGEGTCELFTYAKRHGAITVADYSIGKGDENVNIEIVSSMLRCTDYILPSYSEAVSITKEQDEKKIIRAFLDMGATNIILKLGDKGCLVHTPREEFYMNAYPAKVVDTTGAGDCFAAGFLYGLSKKFPIEKCTRLACAAGSVGVETVGANNGIRNLKQLYSRINMNGEIMS